MNPEKKYVAIAGNIGAGKSSLTRLLAKYFGWGSFFERVDDNPYLGDFYDDMTRWAFNLQVFFLSSRFNHQRAIESRTTSVVQDRSIYEDAEIFARNLFEMANLRTQIISVVIGEGGSGGALAIGVCDHLIMLEYSIYSVISPEGCASILWKDAEKAELAAKSMGITAASLQSLELVDEVLQEPLGGAHRAPEAMAETLQNAIVDNLRQLEEIPLEVVTESTLNRSKWP